MLIKNVLNLLNINLLSYLYVNYHEHKPSNCIFIIINFTIEHQTSDHLLIAYLQQLVYLTFYLILV